MDSTTSTTLIHIPATVQIDSEDLKDSKDFKDIQNYDKILPITPISDVVSFKELKINEAGPNETTRTLSTETDQTDTSNGIASEEKADEKLIKETEWKIIAKRLFDEDFVSIKPEEYLQFLANDDEESTKICHYYMKLFKWSPSLLISTRMLCSKLYLKGESQEIDRILSSFTRSWLTQYPNNLFYTKNFEQIYIIIYSLILLNTALHNSELNKKSRISQNDFIKNTFTTFCQQNPSTSKSFTVKQRIAIETELSQNYESLLKNELNLKTNKSITVDKAGSFDKSDDANTIPNNELSRQATNSSIWSTDTSRKSSLTTKNFNSDNINSNQRVGLARALVGQQQQQQHITRMAELYKQQPLNQQQSLTNQISSPILRQRQSFDNKLNKRSSRSSMISTASNYQSDDISVLSFDTAHFIEDNEYDSQRQGMDHFNVDNYQDEIDLILELQGSPYLKEGLLKYKAFNNDEDDLQQQQQPRKFPFFRTSPNFTRHPIINKFQESFVVVSKGELSIYSFDPKLVKKYKKETDGQNEIGDGNWLNNAVKIGQHNLCSTFAQFEKHTQAPNDIKIFWSLTFPKTTKKPTKKFIFEAGTKEIASEFINTCNFWAAKITAIPTLEESISSIEYGWTNLDGIIQDKENFKRLKIQKWEPVIKGVYLSNYISNDDFNQNGLMKQFIKTSNYYNQLKKLYNDFVKLKSKFLSSLSKLNYNCSNYNRIINNYDLKIDDYRLEMNKYKNYLIILGYGLNLRFNIQDEKLREQKLLQSENEDQTVKEESKEDEKEDEYGMIVKNEIEKIFTTINVSKVIPTFKNTLVKSPKISNFTSPINQLIETTQGNKLNDIEEDEENK